MMSIEKTGTPFFCRIGCGACCIAISISSPIPGMPDGKKAGERCINLDERDTCRIHGRSDYPEVCRKFTANELMCGNSQSYALGYLSNLEQLTKPEKE